MKKEKLKKIKIDKVDKGDLLIWTVGDKKGRFLPSVDDLKKLEEMVTKAMKDSRDGNGPINIFVPSFVNVKKIKLDENVKLMEIKGVEKSQEKEEK